MRAAKVQASLRIRAVSPEPSLLAHTSSESRGTVRQKARSLAPLNGWACAVKICHDGMLEDTNSLDGAQLLHADMPRDSANNSYFYHKYLCWTLEKLDTCGHVKIKCGRKISEHVKEKQALLMHYFCCERCIMYFVRYLPNFIEIP